MKPIYRQQAEASYGGEQGGTNRGGGKVGNRTRERLTRKAPGSRAVGTLRGRGARKEGGIEKHSKMDWR